MSTAKIHISDMHSVPAAVAAAEEALGRLITPDTIRALTGNGCRSVSVGIYPPVRYGNIGEVARVDLERPSLPAHAGSLSVALYALPVRTRMGIINQDVWQRLCLAAPGVEPVACELSSDASFASARLLVSVATLQESGRPVTVSAY